MHRKSSTFLRLATLALVTTALPGIAVGQNKAGKEAVVLNAFAAQPLSFEASVPRKGKSPSYFARGSGYSLYLNSGDAVFALRRPSNHFPGAVKNSGSGKSEVLHMRLAGANRQAVATAQEPLPGTVSYFLGKNPSQWRTDLPTFGRVRYAGVYPGVDLVYYGNQKKLEYDFAVAPHADPSAIRLKFDGAQRISIDRSGALTVKLSHGAIRWDRPVVYQNIHGSRHAVNGRFVRKDATDVGFLLARYDATQPLVIDPILSYSTYFKGAGTDVARSMATDKTGNVYLVGNTTSADFPITQAGYLGTNAGGGSYPDTDIFGTLIQGDGFVIKLNSAGYIMKSAYIGGTNGATTAYGVALDANANIFITGTTNAGDFPTIYADQSRPSIEDLNDGEPRHTFDAFLFKMDPGFNAAVFSTRIGGKFTDIAYAVAVDTQGNSYVTGTTNSPDLLRKNDDPKTRPPGETNHVGINANAFNNAGFGAFDAFVTAFTPSGRMFYETYFGGGGDDQGYGIAAFNGLVYVTGKGTPGMPTRNPANGTASGASDAFLAVFQTSRAAGDSLAYATYLGGSNDDRGMGVAVDSDNNVYVCGVTNSPDFITTNDAVQEFIGGSSDGFLAKYSLVGSAGGVQITLNQTYGTFIGGTFNDELRSVAVDALHNVYLAGVSTSSDVFGDIATPLQIPYASLDGRVVSGNILGAFDFKGTPDHTHNTIAFGVGWIGKITPDGALAWATNWAGTSHTAMNAIAVDAGGRVYFAGETTSNDYPTLGGAYQPTSAGGQHVAFGKIIPTVQYYLPYDLDRDGHQDLFFQSTADGTVSYVLMVNSSIKDARILFYTDSTVPPYNQVPQMKPPVVATADLDGDGYLDFLFQDTSTGNITYTLERPNADFYGQGTVAEPYYDGYIFTGLDKSWKLVAAVDLNGDKKPDLLFQNSVTGGLFAVMMDGITPLYGLDQNGKPTIFKYNLLSSAATGFEVVGTPDITGDGQPDVVFQGANGDIYYVPTANSNGGLALKLPGGFLLQNIDPNYRLKGFIDINGDGIPDMIFQNRSTGDLAYGLMSKPVNGHAVPPRVYGFIGRGVDLRQQVVGIH